MAYHHDLSQSEIAGILGIPLGTVKSRTFHALRAMSALLESGAIGVGLAPERAARSAAEQIR